jgi:hypothetical protein
MKPKSVQYGVMLDVDGDVGYWSLYETVEDAVSDQGDGTEVYRAEFKPIGRFKRAVKIQRIKKRKKKK